MPNSQIATRTAERICKLFDVHEVNAPPAAKLIDAELAAVREALTEALNASEATEGGGYRAVNDPLRAALAFLEVKNAY